MTNQLLFYEQAVPVSLDRHREWCVERAGYAFSRSTNSVPLTTVEFGRAAAEYPIVFAPVGEQRVPVAVLGVADRENLFIGEDGDWKANYIPAFVRRYPFVFATTDEGNSFAVCIDEGFAGCNEEGRGERLFDDQGQRTPYLERVLAFLQEYQAQFQNTAALCSLLVELGLLEPMQANVSLDGGRQFALTGFEVISREKLKALPAERVEELFRRDALELVYQHLQSMHAFSTMVERLAVRGGGEGAAPG